MLRNLSNGVWLHVLTISNASRRFAMMAACSVAEYDDGRIKRHELTRPDNWHLHLRDSAPMRSVLPAIRSPSAVSKKESGSFSNGC